MEMKIAKEILEKNGIETKLVTVNKEGKQREALSIGSGSVVPTIYQDNLDGISDEAEMLRFADMAMSQIPSFDVRSLFTKEFFLSHVRSCLRPVTGDEESITYPAFGDLEEYFRVFLSPEADGIGSSVVVGKEHIQRLGIDPVELRQAARVNLREQAQILPMSAVISAVMGMAVFEKPEDEMIFVASTRDKLHGASVMLLGDVLTDFCRDQGLDSVCIIPSSRHEVLLVKGNMDRESIDSMIQEVNETQVAEQDILSNHGYWFTAA